MNFFAILAILPFALGFSAPVKDYPCGGGTCTGTGTCCDAKSSDKPCCPLESATCCDGGFCCDSAHPTCVAGGMCSAADGKITVSAEFLIAMHSTAVEPPKAKNEKPDACVDGGAACAALGGSCCYSPDTSHDCCCAAGTHCTITSGTSCDVKGCAPNTAEAEFIMTMMTPIAVAA